MGFVVALTSNVTNTTPRLVAMAAIAMVAGTCYFFRKKSYTPRAPRQPTHGQPVCGKVSKVFIYPVKGCAGFEVPAALGWPLTPVGLLFDRVWAIAVVPPSSSSTSRDGTGAAAASAEGGEVSEWATDATRLPRIKSWNDLPRTLRIKCTIDVEGRTLRCAILAHVAPGGSNGESATLAPLVLPLPAPEEMRRACGCDAAAAPATSTAAVAAAPAPRRRYLFERSGVAGVVEEASDEATAWFQRALGREDVRFVRFVATRPTTDNSDAVGSSHVLPSDGTFAQCFGSLHAVAADGLEWLATAVPAAVAASQAPYCAERFRANLLVNGLSMEELDQLRSGGLQLDPLWAPTPVGMTVPPLPCHPLAEYVESAPTEPHETGFVEPEWASLRFAKWTDRCFLPTCDPVTGAANKAFEPTATLKRLRLAKQPHHLPGAPGEHAAAAEAGGMMGVDWLHNGVGLLRSGAWVQSSEAQVSPVFIQK